MGRKPRKEGKESRGQNILHSPRSSEDVLKITACDGGSGSWLERREVSEKPFERKGNLKNP